MIAALQRSWSRPVKNVWKTTLSKEPRVKRRKQQSILADQEHSQNQTTVSKNATLKRHHGGKATEGMGQDQKHTKSELSIDMYKIRQKIKRKTSDKNLQLAQGLGLVLKATQKQLKITYLS